MNAFEGTLFVPSLTVSEALSNVVGLGSNKSFDWELGAITFSWGRSKFKEKLIFLFVKTWDENSEWRSLEVVQDEFYDPCVYSNYLKMLGKRLNSRRKFAFFGNKLQKES